MPKSTTFKKSARLVRRGDVVQVPLSNGESTEEVVRSVGVILHLANGTDIVIESGEDVSIVKDTEINEGLQAQLQAMLSEESEQSNG